jgi:hypothetical protein
MVAPFRSCPESAGFCCGGPAARPRGSCSHRSHRGAGQAQMVAAQRPASAHTGRRRRCRPERRGSRDQARSRPPDDQPDVPRAGTVPFLEDDPARDEILGDPGHLRPAGRSQRLGHRALARSGITARTPSRACPDPTATRVILDAPPMATSGTRWGWWRRSGRTGFARSGRPARAVRGASLGLACTYGDDGRAAPGCQNDTRWIERG